MALTDQPKCTAGNTSDDPCREDSAEAPSSLACLGTTEGFRLEDNAWTQDIEDPPYEMCDHKYNGSFESTTAKFRPLAVVGFSLKFPQEATSTESFWSMIMDKRNAMTEFPTNRMNVDAFYHPDPTRRDTLPLRGGHFLSEDLGAFDAPFFSITPAEAADMEPMQRGLLETTYRALESAGIPMESIARSKTSVYNGCFTNDYQNLLCKDPQAPPKYAATGVAASMLANRISWFFDLLGPSVNLDSACSSSMMAFDMACQGLWNDESTMAIVAGSNLIYSIDTLSTLSNMGFLSQDSRCYSFDHRANGYGRGEGFGVIILKPLSAAIENGDMIRAVVRATGTNQDGRTPGITQPNKLAQEQLIKETYGKAGLDMRATRFFEAHGTGTPLGDPIEASAIGAAFSNEHDRSEPLYVGALKSNIGHLEGASGVAGLIKAILVLERAWIPPNANFQLLNPEIDAENLNLRFPTEGLPWPNDDLRRASVNSFGFGGTNTHVVLDDAYNYLRLNRLAGNHCTTSRLPLTTMGPHGPSGSINGLVNGSHNDRCQETVLSAPELLIWSAADEHGLERLAIKYGEYLSNIKPEVKDPGFYLRRLGYTLAKRRSSLQWKSFIVTDSLYKLCNPKLQLSKPVKTTADCNLGFVFTGQGAQWPRMGVELLQYSTFRDCLKKAETFFQSLGCQWSLIDELEKSADKSRIHQAVFCQPVCTALQIALVDLLRSFSIYPKTVIGHSSGEIAAAYCVGAISFQSSLKLAYYRGLLAHTMTAAGHKPGAMMSVGLDENQILPFFTKLALVVDQPDITIACYNSPRNITISGDEGHINILKDILDKEKIFNRKLNVGIAYHSSHMDAIAAEYAEMVKDLEKGDPSQEASAARMVSTVTGQIVSVDALCEADYWVTNLISPVRFSHAIRLVCSINGENTGKRFDGGHRKAMQTLDLLELGPHSALQSPLRDTVKSQGEALKTTYHSALIRQKPGATSMLEALGRLYCIGHYVDVGRVNSPSAKDMNGLAPLIDLPEYPFDHSKELWTESRLSKAFRFRKEGRLDLLGTPEIDWNPKQAKWRHIIKISELPWVEDHAINGRILYPAAGILVMAIEASKQTSNPELSVRGFNIRDTVFQNALSIPRNEDSIETRFYLRPKSTEADCSWSQFQLYGLTQGDWTEIAHGLIQVEYEEDDAPIDGGLELSKTYESYLHMYEAGRKACETAIDSQQMYEYLQSCGLDYGSTFQRLQAMTCNRDGEAVGKLVPFKWIADQGTNPPQPHVIHPVTLDGAFQLLFIAVSKGGAQKIPTMVPTKLRKLWISNSSPASSDSVTSLYSKAQSTNRHSEGLIIGFDSIDKSIRIVIEHLEATVVARSTENVQSVSADVQPCYQVDSKPDICLLTREQTLDYCLRDRPYVHERIPISKDLQLLMLTHLSRTLDYFDKSAQDAMEPHHQKYIAWTRFQLDRFNAGTLPCVQPEWPDLIHDIEYQARLAGLVEEASPGGKLFVKVGRNLIKILTKAVDPLAILFEGETAKCYYEEVANSVGFNQPMARYLDALAHKNPGMSIVEVGAGTGTMTAFVMKTLMPDHEGVHSIPRYSQYWFTDISRSFFQPVKDKFKDQGARMRFSTLNIEDDPITQGFEQGACDLVIAAGVLHATRNLDVTIRNVRKLLKPGGKLLLIENTKPDKLGCGFVFGLLPGWWQDDADRRWSPCIGKNGWDEIATRNGFSSSDLALDDYMEESCKEFSAMVFTAIEPSYPGSINKLSIALLIASGSTGQQKLAVEAQSELKAAGYAECRIVTFTTATSDVDLGSEFCISLLEIDGPIFDGLDIATFGALQTLLTSGTNLLWVTNFSKYAVPPCSGILEGLARTIRTENPQLVLVTLALQDSGMSPHGSVAKILLVLRATLAGMADSSFEREFMEEDGMLHISRITEAKTLMQKTFSQTLSKRHTVKRFGEGPPLRLLVESPGLLDSLTFVEDRDAESALANNEVEIEVMAVGLNFMDLLGALGRLDNLQCLGSECAGIVTRSGGEADLKVGNRVAMTYLDAFKTRVRCPYQCAVRIPDDISFAEAAAIPTTFTTAFHSLHEIARLQNGDSILIHSAAGGTGQSALQIAQYLGAEVYTTVSSDEKKHFLMDRYGIPEDHIFYSRNTSFSKGIRRMTQGRGVDVILNSLAGEMLVASWECIAPYGRFIEIGKKDIQSNSNLPMFPFAKNVTFSAVDMAGMGDTRPLHIRRMLEEVMELVTAGKIHPPRPIQEFRVSDIEQAFRHIQTGKNMGKVVITVNKRDEVKMMLNTQPSFIFDSNASYVLAGGLGGLGRSISRWMTARGAKNLILLSRSGPKHEFADAFKKELEGKGVNVATPACDIASVSSTEIAIDNCMKTMPPIKGCFQAAMVLKDRIFNRMTFEEWNAAIAPKVKGSWNLHNILPKGMDFFIFFSSLCGIVGKETMANYSAGNAYVDALARYRIRLGEKAVSLDLGIMEEEGILAENPDLMAKMKASGTLISINPVQLHALLAYFCDPRLGLLSPSQSQVVIGIELPANLRSKGLEPASWMHQPIFNHFFQMDKIVSADTNADRLVDFAALFPAISSKAEAGARVADALMDKMSSAIAIPKEDMDMDRPLIQYGVDSLVAVEIRSWFAKKLEADITVFDILGDSTFREIGWLAVGKSPYKQSSWVDIGPDVEAKVVNE